MRDLGNIAFLGVGHMGGAMARRLAQSGFAVKVWNRSPAKAKALEAAGVVPCASPRKAAEDADFVCLCLTDGAANAEVLFGSPGLATALEPGTVVIDFATSHIVQVRDLSQRVAETSGAVWLDAPVSGGVPGAEAGTLAIFVGGEAETLERARPLLDRIAVRVTHMGPVGAGQAAKLCNQLIVSTTLAAIAEAMALGKELGVDAARLPEGFQGGFADSRPLQIFGPRMAAAQDPGPPMSEMRTMYKDVRAVRDIAASMGLPMPLMERVDTIYRRLIDLGFGGEDLPTLMNTYRGGARDVERTDD